MLYVGDSGVDMQTAINAGVTSCGVTWGFPPTDRVRGVSPRLYRRQSGRNLKTDKLTSYDQKMVHANPYLLLYQR